jgi:hypothetical protein
MQIVDTMVSPMKGLHLFPPVCLRMILFVLGVTVFSPQIVRGEEDIATRNKEIAKGFDAAEKVLKAFLGAPTWEEAATYVLDKEILAEAMKAHYAKYPWKPVEIAALRYVGGSQVKGKVTYITHDFQLVPKDKPNLVPLTMVQDGDHYLLDWEIFAQTYDGTFEDFLKGKDESIHSFRVVMHRGVVMEDHEALGLEGGVIRLRVAWRPGVFFPGEFFAPAKSDIGKKIEERVPWQEGAAFRVKVKWSKTKDGSRSFIEVVGMDALNFSTPSVFN